jgi:transcriptional regulator with XRE-family HTH domain
LWDDNVSRTVYWAIRPFPDPQRSQQMPKNAVAPIDEELPLDRLIDALGKGSPTAQRLRALRQIGFTNVEIAEILGVTEEAVRGWLYKNARPRPRAFQGIENMRRVALLFLTKGKSEETVYSWFNSAMDDFDPASRTPRDLILDNFGGVLAAAQTFLKDGQPASLNASTAALGRDPLPEEPVSETELVEGAASRSGAIRRVGKG